MRTEIIAAGIIVAGAVGAVRVLDEPEPAQKTLTAATISPAPLSPVAPSRWDREVRVRAARDYQFYIDAEINRRRAHFLIDTGASYVALRDSDAREAGIYIAWADYTYPVRTANGETKAALINIEEIEIHGIRIENVKAFVLPDDQLSINLLGMSFLSRLDSVEARGGELVLRG
ncbi:MAG: TIGR02281 family clan AA aspartic protease [Pseudomonadota bacterium]